VLTAGSNPVQSKIDSRNVTVVVRSATQRTALADRTMSVTAAPSKGRKMTIDVM
jgi:hypothetical protein